jgi:hypothetical protein
VPWCVMLEWGDDLKYIVLGSAFMRGFYRRFDSNEWSASCESLPCLLCLFLSILTEERY